MKTFILNFIFIGLVLFYLCFIYYWNIIFAFLFVFFILASVVSLVTLGYEILSIILIVCWAGFVAYAFWHYYVFMKVKFKHLILNADLLFLVVTFFVFLFLFFFL